MERAIEFLLKNQAGFDAKLDRLADQVSETSKQVAEMNGRLRMHAETQTELIQISLRNAEEQRQINAEFRAAIRALAAAQTRTDESLRQLSSAQARTDESLRQLSSAQARTDESLRQLSSAQARTDAQLSQTNESLRNLAEAQTRTDERLNRTSDNLNSLAETVRRFVEGRG
ncbi:MAG TPA: hypothetical protein VF538_15160 [Pyrinomonadaceae bacterium]